MKNKINKLKKKLNKATTRDGGGVYCANCEYIKEHSDDLCFRCSGACVECQNENGFFVGFDELKNPIFLCSKCGDFKNNKLNLEEEEY